jgi:5-methylcytosine-specific restriction protein A
MSDLPSPYSVTPRKALSSKERLDLFLFHKGVCVLCGGQITVSDKWIVEHVKPLHLDGTNDTDNLGPAHEICAKPKTAKEATARARGRSFIERHLGAKRPKGFRKPKGAKFDWSQGRYVVRRDEE